MELAEVGPKLTQHATTLSDYTNTAVFVPDLDDDGNEVTPSWFGLDPMREEDSTEEIASSDEGDDDNDFEEDKDDALEDGAGGQP